MGFVCFAVAPFPLRFCSEQAAMFFMIVCIFYKKNIYKTTRPLIFAGKGTVSLRYILNFLI